MRIKTKNNSFSGIVSLPGDKSIAHRALLHASLAMGDSRISNFPNSDDVFSTLKALKSLKVPIIRSSNGEIVVMGGGGEFKPPDTPIDCGNSGTTMRLLMGILAGAPFESKLVGDESLSRRPMDRVAQPLKMMGARIQTQNGFPPVNVVGKSPLKIIEYELPIASAQLKSALFYAALFAEGESIIREPLLSRDHTEIAFETLCGECYRRVVEEGLTVHYIKGGFEIPSFEINIPGDPSSAAFLVALALLMPDSQITFRNLLLNPRRIRYLEILRNMGGNIKISQTGKELGEIVGEVVVRTSEMVNIEIDVRDIPLIIDEIPILAVISTMCEGEFVIRNAEELRFKESDRIASIVRNLCSLGADVVEYQDGFAIKGKSRLKAGEIDYDGDHRILMSLIVLSITHGLDLEFNDLSPMSVSFPEFLDFVKLLSN